MRRLLARVHGNFGVFLVLTGVLVFASQFVDAPRGVLLALAFLWALLWNYTPTELWETATGVARRIQSRPRDQRYWNALLPVFGPPLFGIVAISGWPQVDPPVDPGFYSTLAQVIPVLFLAGIVPLADWRDHLQDHDDRALLRLLITGISLGAFEGEVAALYALATSTTSLFLLVTLVGALTMQFAGVILAVAYRS